RPWNPQTARAAAVADSVRRDSLRALMPQPVEPTDHELPTEAGTTRTLDLLYQPGVPDSILPLTPVYRELSVSGPGSVYVGALRQDLPTRAYPVMLRGASMAADVDGATGQTHAAIMVMVPWFGNILHLPRTRITLGVKLDAAPEQEWKLECTPGPNLYMPGK